MIEPLLRRFVELKQRKIAVITLTILTLLAVVWPAVDAYIAAQKRLETAQEELAQAEQDVRTLPQRTQEFIIKQERLRRLELERVPEPVAQKIRDNVTQLVRDTGCMMLTIKLFEPTSRAWMENDHPISGPRRADRGKKTPYELVTRRLSVSITGHLAAIHQYLARVNAIEKFIHTQHVSMRRNETDPSKTVLVLDLLLFDLVRKAKS